MGVVNPEAGSGIARPHDDLSPTTGVVTRAFLSELPVQMPTFDEVPFVAAMCDPGMAHTIKMYQSYGLDRPRFFQARHLMQYLIVIFGRVPLPPDGKLTPYLSMTSSTLPIPHHSVGPRPSDDVFFEACRQLAPDVNFEIDTQSGGSPFCVHGFAA